MKAWFHSPSSVSDPFAGLAAVLGAAAVHVDPQRQSRKGVPEIVYAAGKSPALTLSAARALLADGPTGRVLVSRASPETAEALRSSLEPDGVRIGLSAGGETLL